MDLANPNKKPPMPLAVKVMTVTAAVTALSALLLARGDESAARGELGTVVERLRIAGQDVDVPTALCFAGVLVAGAFVLRYVVSIGGPQDPYVKSRRAQAAARRRERSLAQR